MPKLESAKDPVSCKNPLYMDIATYCALLVTLCPTIESYVYAYIGHTRGSR